MREKLETIRIGILGNVDSGKSTLVGVITKLVNEYDDGRGYARSKIFIHKHEKESGRTSAITKESIKKENKIIELVDLAGHEKYFKTTIKGICNNCIDYILLLVNGNMGNLTKMTKEHLYLTLSLRLPLIILITKIDISPENIILETINNIKRILKGNQKVIYTIKDEKELQQNIYKSYMNGEEMITKKCVPIIKISNKTGENIDLLKNFIFKLKNTYQYDIDNINKKFIINNKYNLHGIGIVLTGILNQGNILKGDILYLNKKNRLIKLQIKSIHDDFQNNIDQLYMGESGCLAIKILDKGIISKKLFKNGDILMDKPEMKTSFMAKILISNTSITIKEKYQPVINTMSINQGAILEKIINEENSENEKKLIRMKEMALVKFRFLYHPECITKDQLFIFRDGNIKGIGKIIETY